MKKCILALITLLLISTSAKPGIVVDDPVDIRAEGVAHLFSKDEIKFTLAGKNKKHIFNDVEFTLTLNYSDKTRTIHASKGFWADEKPLVILLPDGLADLQSYTLSGKYESAWEWNGYVPQNNGDKEHDLKELAKSMKPVTGYKIDSKFVVN